MEKEKKLIAPYSKLAYIYDEVMAHVDYKLWADYVKKIIARQGINPKTFLDVSCGTGSLLLSLYKKSVQFFGCDYSHEMLRQARQKTGKKSIHFFRADMTKFALREKMDVICCLYDSINYLLDPIDWKKNLLCAFDALRFNGLYIFDICTELNSIEFFDDYVEQKSGYGYRYIRESFFDRERKIHHNKFFLEFDGDNTVYVEDHQQLILPVADVINLISETPFEIVHVFDGFTFLPGSEKSLRIHFVLRKQKDD